MQLSLRQLTELRFAIEKAKKEERQDDLAQTTAVEAAKGGKDSSLKQLEDVYQVD